MRFRIRREGLAMGGQEDFGANGLIGGLGAPDDQPCPVNQCPAP
jgi:hypothetical protein